MMAELMNLCGRIRVDVSELQKIASLAVRRSEKSKKDADYLGSVAFDCHSFYQGIERIFTMVARNIDGAVPSGQNWHKDLLDQMARELPGCRPAVISPGTHESLQAFRRFRHLARNIYAFELDPVKIHGLAQSIQETCDDVCSELLAFADFLSQAGSVEGDAG